MPPFVAALVLVSLGAASASDYVSTILADNPVAYLRLEETSGTVAADSSASGAFPGTYVMAGSHPVLGQPGIDTNSISLSAAQSASVTMGYYAELNEQAPFSVEIWARPVSVPSGGNYRCPVGNFSGWGVANPSGWYIYQTPDVPSALAFVTPSGVWISTTHYTLLDWHHLVGTYDGTVMSFYVNGELIGTQDASGYVANSVENAGINSLALGDRGDAYGFFDGGLDEFAYYATALTPAQVATHYEVGTNSFRSAILPPSILSDVVSADAYAGHPVTFKVTADGTAPLSYQWYKGEAPVGVDSDTLTFTCVPEDDGTTYRVEVSNSAGTVTSSTATLTVSTALEILAPLTTITRNVGSAAAFEIEAEGAFPIRYQWKSWDGTPIAGATNSTLWLSDVQLADSGATYYVSVSNPYNSTDSWPVTLIVQPRPVTVPVSGYANVVLADEPVAYWQLDETSGPTAVDTVGSFDGTYEAGEGSFTFGVPTGIPHHDNGAVRVTGGATISIPYAIEINPPGPFSVEGWFQPDSVATDGNDYRTALSSMSNPFGVGPTGWLVYQTSGNNWSWWPYHGFWTGIQLTDPDQIVAGEWYYLALTYDGGTFTLYVNGEAKASAADAGFVQNGEVPVGGAESYNYNYNTTEGLPEGSGPYTLGWRSDSGFNPFSGAMDDIAVYNKALSWEQIQNHFLNTTRLAITRSGDHIVISWPVGTLLSSTEVEGPYLEVVGATSPYTNAVSGEQRYFRVELP